MKFFRGLVNGCAMVLPFWIWVALVLFVKEWRSALMGLGLFLLMLVMAKTLGG